MAKAIIAAGGGGGTGSDERTATGGDVLKGKTAVTSDSDDEAAAGTLELTGNAGTGDVVYGKTFYTVDPKSKKTGTLADKNGTIQSATATLDNTNSRLQMTIPETGRYNTASKLYTAFSAIATLIGLTAAKLAQGQKILGISGTYKGLGNATAAQVLSGRTFSTSSLSNETGTMANRGAVTSSLNAGGSYTIPAGYHNGSGKVTANALSGQTSGTAVAADIVTGKTAWVNGSKITGNMGTMAGGTYHPTASQQIISCAGKKMTSNIIIAGVYKYAYKSGVVTSSSSKKNFKAVGYEENGLDRYYLTFATGFHVLGYSYNWDEDAQDGGFSLTPTSCYYQRGTIETTPALYTVTANETQIIVPVYYQGRNYRIRVYGYYD